MFLHQVKPGAAAGSYGVQVAKLAGVPPRVVARADTLLAGFLKVAHGKGVVKVDELSLFAAPVAVDQAPASPLELKLRGLDVDGMSARDALAALYELRGLAGDRG